MERQRAPFGEIPALVPGDHQLLVRTDRTVVQLAGFFALPSGVLATLRATTTAPDLIGVEVGFEQHNPTGGPDHLTVTADIPSRPDVSISANLAKGGGGHDNGVHARSYTMWFPVDVDSVPDVVRFTIAWPEAGCPPQSIEIPKVDLLTGARGAVRLRP